MNFDYKSLNTRVGLNTSKVYFTILHKNFCFTNSNLSYHLSVLDFESEFIHQFSLKRLSYIPSKTCLLCNCSSTYVWLKLIRQLNLVSDYQFGSVTRPMPACNVSLPWIAISSMCTNTCIHNYALYKKID
jgi:hypothetical protein